MHFQAIFAQQNIFRFKKGKISEIIKRNINF